MNISVVIPAYNEENRIGKTLRKINQFMKDYTFNIEEIIVVDDGSTDNTVNEVIKFPNVILVSYSPNRGKGYALRSGIKKAKSDFIYLCDADLSSPIQELKKFISKIDEYDVVIGSRAVKGAREKSSIFRTYIGKIGNKIIKLILGLDIQDTQCGFKLLNKKASKVLQNSTLDGWGIDFEFLYQAEKKGLKIFELPVKWEAVGDSKLVFGGYVSTLNELYKVWKKEIGFSQKFVMSLLKKLNKVFKYITVGIITNGLNVLMFLLAINLISTPIDTRVGSFQIPYYLIIDSINYLLTIVFLNYLLHKLWTFKSKKFSYLEILRYILVLIFNYLISSIFLVFLIEVLGVSESISKVFSTLLVVCWNFMLLRFFVFKIERVIER